MEDETSRFADYFADRCHEPGNTVQEAVLDLHDEALHCLTDIAQSRGITGSNEYMRSVALQLCLDQFTGYALRSGDDVLRELHLSAGAIKPRTLCLFTETLDDLSTLERSLHCSETILLESAIRYCTEAVLAT